MVTIKIIDLNPIGDHYIDILNMVDLVHKIRW